MAMPGIKVWLHGYPSWCLDTTPTALSRLQLGLYSVECQYD